MARSRTRKIGAIFTNPVTGKSVRVRTPKGTISEAKLVRAFHKGFYVAPDGKHRFSSKPVQDVLKNYSAQLERANQIQKERESINWRHWEERGLVDDGWIQFRRTIHELIKAITASS